MPSGFQEWLSLGLVAFTVGVLLGRWLSKRKQNTKNAACGDCPQSESPNKQFKNIPINVVNKGSHKDHDNGRNN
jgi:hypothetical protein